MATSTISNADYLRYKPGDSFSGELGVFGYVTTSGTDVWIIFSPPKLLTGISNFTINSLSMYVRGRVSNSSTGSYIGSTGYNPLTDSTVTLNSKRIVNGGGALALCFRKTSSWGKVNNTTVFGSIMINITFT